jgi:23S rRNA (cytidine1920-2'-O)/16S rRNA (cytidine1409-2'-O)-methyltransferase
MTRRRLDAELVRRGLAGSREEAREVVLAGRVTVGGRSLNTPATMVAPEEPVVVRGTPEGFVSRGARKLDAGLTRFGVDPTGRDALDAGASTGGFTDRLLRGGARRVIAVDVGYGQLAWDLRTDDRVVVMERTNVRDLRPEDLPFAPDLIVADLSFVSLASTAPALARLCAPGGEMLLLVKPQFEADRGEVGAGGVVSDPAVWRRAILRVAAALEGQGVASLAVIASPLLGPAGNVEFVLHARPDLSNEARPIVGLDEAIAEGEALRR